MHEPVRSPNSGQLGGIVNRWSFHSLRWRLQAWYALVLVSVLMVFGLVVNITSWQNRLQQIDAELDRTAEVITSRLRRLFPWPQPFRGPGRWPTPPRSGGDQANRSGRPPQRSGEVAANLQEPNLTVREPNLIASRETNEAFASRSSERPQNPGSLGDPAGRRDRGISRRENSDDNAVSALFPVNASRGPRETTGVWGSRPNEWPAPQPGPMPPPGPLPFGQWPIPSLGLPDEFLQLFEGDEDTRLYFVIWDHQGKVLQKSDSAPEIDFPALKVGEDKLPIRSVRMRDSQREVIHVSSFDINLLVGRSIVGDMSIYHRSSLLRLAVGVVVLLSAGLVGGWWSTTRAIRPIAAMTAAAESISVQRLSQRIDVQQTDDELGQLATVLNQTFDRLQASFEQQTRFTADASHELRTPLSVILAHADLSLSRERTPEEYRSTLETCRRASRRMKSLIDGLLTLARFDSDAANLQLTQFDLGSLARECIDLVRPLAVERRITIDATLASTILRGDRERLSQVITNLLTNAIRYNRDDGKVHVTVASENGTVVISVADTGIGIPADELPHIFDRFYRVDKVRSRAEGSSGLGLSISRTIVASHGGTIVARSEPDVGTVIEVRLPTATFSHGLHSIKSSSSKSNLTSEPAFQRSSDESDTSSFNMYEPILRLTEIAWLPMFVAFVTSLLLSGKYSLQLLLGKQNRFRAVEIICGLMGTAVVCFLARDVLDWWHAHSPTTPQPLWGVAPIGLAIAASSLHFQFAKLTLPACDLRSSSVVWSMILCSLGTTYWSAHRLQEEENHDVDVLVESAFRMNDGAMNPAEVNAVTDRGRVIPLFHWQRLPDSTESAAASPKNQGADYAEMLITRSAPTTDTNCHGWVFADGRYVVRSKSVVMILEDNGYTLTETPLNGDLVVHRNRLGEIHHTGLVRAVFEDGTVIEESKWGIVGSRYLHPSDSQPYGPATYYRSPRQGHLLTTVPVDHTPKPPITMPGGHGRSGRSNSRVSASQNRPDNRLVTPVNQTVQHRASPAPNAKDAWLSHPVSPKRDGVL